MASTFLLITLVVKTYFIMFCVENNDIEENQTTTV